VSGYLRAYATSEVDVKPVSARRLASAILSPSQATLLWAVDTAQDYVTVNGVPAHGGAMDGPGPTIADGMLYVNSGYAQWGGLAGNVLLAFEVGRP
jgi:hypothetical protein